MLTENVAMNIDVDFFKARVSRALEAEMRGPGLDALPSDVTQTADAQ